MDFSERAHSIISKKNTCLVLGLDPDISRMPAHLRNKEPLHALETFCNDILDAVSTYICAVKIQMAWFEMHASAGIALVERLCLSIRRRKLLVIIDGKRSDIGVSANAYAQAYLASDAPFQADALTVNPWLGSDSLTPFIEYARANDKAVFVLVKTSNPSADELQGDTSLQVAEMVRTHNASCLSANGLGAVGAVVGATRAGEELSDWRRHMPNAWLLTPGVGAQGGNIGNVLKLRTEQHTGVLIPLSRSILYAGKGRDFANRAAIAIRRYWLMCSQTG